MSETDSFDAVIVGSGASGGWAAMKLTRAGLRVAVLDAGRALQPQKDFTDHTPPSQIPLRGKALTRAAREEQPVQSSSYAFSEYNRHFFVDDRENPYSAPKDRPFDWIRARVVGGRTLLWGRVALRFSDLDFEAGKHDGASPEWPLRYAELAPYYDEVERFIGVNGMAEGLSHLPDGKFLEPMKLSCVEWRLRHVLAKRFGRTLTISRSAQLTQDWEGRAKCHYCGPCEHGCMTGSYFSSPASTLPAADATGRMTLITGAAVSHVTVDPHGKARGVKYVDTASGRQREVRGRAVLLAASSLESTRILLNSRSPAHPNGLGNESGVLGHYLMDHVSCFLGLSSVPGFESAVDSPGERTTTFYIPRFQNLSGSEPKRKFVRGYGIQGLSHDTGLFGHAYAVPGIGAQLKEGIRRGRRSWYLLMIGFGECLPRFENHCQLDSEVKDRWGIPALRVEMAFGENEKAMVEDMHRTGAEMMASVGAKSGEYPPGNPGSSIHETGTARMGNDPKTSFLNRWNQSHAVPNLFVIDGAAFPSSPCQNPTLTIMALAARASDHLAAELKRRNL